MPSASQDCIVYQVLTQAWFDLYLVTTLRKSHGKDEGCYFTDDRAIDKRAART